MRRRRIIAAAASAAALLTMGAAPAAAAPVDPGTEVQRTAEAEVDPDATVPVPLPDLGLAARRGDGGITLFRMPLSEIEDGFGTPQVVRAMSARTGFLFDRSRYVAGDFANFTPGEDGTADHLIGLARADGGLDIWVVPGSTDTTPRRLHQLPRSAGWSWADARLSVGDVDGDAWDDLVLRHRSGTRANVFALISNGTTLAAPVLWQRETLGAGGLDGSRSVLGDYDGDFDEDRLVTVPTGSPTANGINIRPFPSSGTAFTGPGPISSQDLGPFNFSRSRDVVGDVDGDGRWDLVNVHRSGRGGVVVFPQLSVDTGSADVIGVPELWQTLAGSWSFDYSRQLMADTDADGNDDLISIHKTARGIGVYRHLSTGTAFAAPELLNHLIGWNFAATKESVADTWGEIIV